MRQTRGHSLATTTCHLPREFKGFGGTCHLERICNTSAREFFDLLDQLGTIEKGKIADLVILEANPLKDIANTKKISAVVVNGRLIDKAELNRILADAEVEAKK